MPYLATSLTEQSHLSEYGSFTDHLLKADNLYQALQFLIQEISLHHNNNYFWLQENDQCVWICRPQHPYIKDNQWQVEQHVMSLICMLIEYYAGVGWLPKQIKLQDNEGVGIGQSRFFKNAEIKLGQPYSAIAIDHSLLRDRSSIGKLSKPFELEYIPDSFVHGLKLLLKQNYFGQGWLAENIATTLETSVRTLKRKLHAQGTSLRQVFDEVRFQQACELIEQDIHDYDVLAEKLSYTHANNFVRAFKRWSGITPREYIRLRNIELLKKNNVSW
jgi:AraC-like DNA-binding protein